MSPTDREKNRFSARAKRYANVGTKVGGVAARMAGARLLGVPARPRRQCPRARRRARRPEGPDHEGGAAARHHSRRAAAGIRQRTDEAAKPGAAHGLGLRQAAHERGTGRRLGKQIQELRASSGGGRLARPGASRPRARRQRACLQAAISRHAVGGRSRRASAEIAVRRSASASIRRSTPPRSPRKSPRACARSSTISARPSTSRSTAPC